MRGLKQLRLRMSKGQAQAWFKELGKDSSYQGKTRTLFVKGIDQISLDSFGLPVDFKLVAQ